MRSLSPAAEPGAGAAPRGRPNELQHWVRRARPTLGTIVEISVGDRRREPQLHVAIDAAFASIERVHDLMSYQAPDSELSRLNREAVRGAQQVHPDTYAVFEAALRAATSSAGAFDPCIAPLLEEWGLLPRIQSTVNPVGDWRDIELLSGRRIRYARPVRADLGGIAKGYAVDSAVRSLQQYGIEDIVVNAGGDLRVAGPHCHSVQLRHPLAPRHSAHSVAICNTALATSAIYFSRRKGSTDEVSALVDPRDGTPYLGGRSVSVRADDCMTADALTKVVMFAPTALAEYVLAYYQAEAYVI
ncbi:MAG: FAD:protein FMN transferase [Gammaproteobacteria bacterium]